MPSAPAKAARVVGVVRVSRSNGREGESFASPKDQRDRIAHACERDGMALLSVTDEIDVSGGKPLATRQGLREAVEAVEAGKADVVMCAYFDRLARSLKVQGEVLERVEAAGGRVVALDVGNVSGESAAQWLSGTMLGAMSEYYRRSVKERSGEAQARAVARGVVPWPNIPPGLQRTATGVLEPNADAPVIREAFNLRADGATIAAVRDFLAGHGIERSYHGVQSILRDRLYTGQIHFGALVNLNAHPAIVDADTWKRVQRVKVSRGRRAKSERLLARLGVLRCATCDARMVVGTAHHGQYHLYRCPPTGDCPRRVTISAELVESIVSDKVRSRLSEAHGRASAASSATEATDALTAAQSNLDAAIRAFAVVADEPATRERLAELRAERDLAQEHADKIGGESAARVISGAGDWDQLTFDEQRGIIRATVDRVSVEPGRGAGRVLVQFFAE